MQVITTQKIVLLHVKYFSYNREVRQSLTSKIWESMRKIYRDAVTKFAVNEKKIDYLGRE